MIDAVFIFYAYLFTHRCSKDQDMTLNFRLAQYQLIKAPQIQYVDFFLRPCGVVLSATG